MEPQETITSHSVRDKHPFAPIPFVALTHKYLAHPANESSETHEELVSN